MFRSELIFSAIPTRNDLTKLKDIPMGEKTRKVR